MTWKANTCVVSDKPGERETAVNFAAAVKNCLGNRGWELQGLSPERIALQKSVDDALTAALDKDVAGYLKHTFTLKGGDRPHLLKF